MPPRTFICLYINIFTTFIDIRTLFWQKNRKWLRSKITVLYFPLLVYHLCPILWPNPETTRHRRIHILLFSHWVFLRVPFLALCDICRHIKTHKCRIFWLVGYAPVHKQEQQIRWLSCGLLHCVAAKCLSMFHRCLLFP